MFSSRASHQFVSMKASTCTPSLLPHRLILLFSGCSFFSISILPFDSLFLRPAAVQKDGANTHTKAETGIDESVQSQGFISSAGGRCISRKARSPSRRPAMNLRQQRVIPESAVRLSLIRLYSKVEFRMMMEECLMSNSCLFFSRTRSSM